MSTAEFTAEFSNTAMGDAAKKIMNFVGKAAKLRDGHPDRLKLAADMAEVIVSVLLIAGQGYVLTATSPRYLKNMVYRRQSSCRSCFGQPWRYWITWMRHSIFLSLCLYGPTSEVTIPKSRNIH
jgi:hypothetical protein